MSSASPRRRDRQRRHADQSIVVDRVLVPTTIGEVVDAVRSHPGPVSIGGGRFSQGGQTATERALQIDMRRFDDVLAFSKERKEITVQAGITWRKIQDYIDPYDLSVRIMQTYANFTVGGSLSVNVHGRYVGQGRWCSRSDPSASFSPTARWSRPAPRRTPRSSTAPSEAMARWA